MFRLMLVALPFTLWLPTAQAEKALSVRAQIDAKLDRKFEKANWRFNYVRKVKGGWSFEASNVKTWRPGARDIKGLYTQNGKLKITVAAQPL